MSGSRRAYTGPLQAVILDWAGTTVDYGCFAPAAVFIKVFKERGVEITMAEARGPMGKYKRDHIREITNMPAVAERWRAAHGRLPNESDVEVMFNDFIPRQIGVLAQYAPLIPGVRETIMAFRERGLKIGSCTGYTYEMMQHVLREAEKQGYTPDSLVCPDGLPGGRPAPWMCFQNAQNMGVYPMEAMVKIGDTVPDIEEGLNAGMWTVAIAQTGNELGLSQDEVSSLAPGELAALMQPIYTKLYQAGAHYVVDSLADTLPILDEIERRVAQGEKP
ncbi:MAG TPA: phosphonoacetaldehyde hydrolase [Aggregatilineaceae bacterium]|jgi:phosphonoacetaldehyde hydrolase|nr:phosphonoacetaldehyde hydrolase [Aggregatilineaceae bacterium]